MLKRYHSKLSCVLYPLRPRRRVHRQCRRRRCELILDEAEEAAASDEDDEDDGEDANDALALAEETALRKEMMRQARKKGSYAAQLVRDPAKGMIKTPADEKRCLNLNVYWHGNNVHFSRIVNLHTYSKCFPCKKCSQTFCRSALLAKHSKVCRGGEVKHLYPGNGFIVTPTIFERLQNLTDINTPEAERYFPFWLAFDWESYNETTPLAAYHRIIWPEALEYKLPELRKPTDLIDPPPEDALDWVKEHWTEVHERRGTRDDYVVAYCPRFKQLLDYIVGLAQLQTRRFHFRLSLICFQSGKLKFQHYKSSAEITGLHDVQAFLGQLSLQDINNKTRKVGALAVRVDVKLTAQEYSAELVPASVCLATNVPGFQDEHGQDKPYFLLSTGDPRDLVRRFVDQLYEMADAAGRLMCKKFQPTFNYLNKRWLKVHLKSMYLILLEHMKEGYVPCLTCVVVCQPVV